MSDAEIANATRQFLKAKRKLISKIMNGLSDRPLKGTKAQAREDFRQLLIEMNELEKVVQKNTKRGLEIYGSAQGRDQEGVTGVA